MNQFDVIVIGGGQSGLALGHYLRRTGLSYVILDNQRDPVISRNEFIEHSNLLNPATISNYTIK